MYRKARRAFLLALILSSVLVTALMFLTALDLSETQGPRTSTVDPLGITIWEATRTVAADETTVSLSPGPGALILVLLLPTAVALIVLLRLRQRRVAQPATAG
jgi:hypothetical protein